MPIMVQILVILGGLMGMFMGAILATGMTGVWVNWHKSHNP